MIFATKVGNKWSLGLKLPDHRLCEFCRADEQAARAVRCPLYTRPMQAHASTAASTALCFVFQAEAVTQQHRRTENRASRIGFALSSDVRRRTMYRLIQAHLPDPSDAEGSIPSDPASTDASSLRMSPNILLATITSKLAGRVSRCIVQASTSRCSSATSA